MSLQTSAGKATVLQFCGVFGMHRSTYYEACKLPGNVVPLRREPEKPRGVSTAVLLDAVRKLAADHPAWGYRKLWAVLRRDGVRVAQRRVYALCVTSRAQCRPPDRSVAPSLAA